MFVSENQASEPRSRGRTHESLIGRIAAEMDSLLAEPLAPGLYLVATPIGNLADISLRALSVLSRADVIYCEDTRHSAKLLQRYAIAGKTQPFHEHNEDRSIARAVRDLEAGKRIAVVSDAGTPLLSDPGFKLVRAAATAGIPVFSIPGPSAALTALTTSGLPTDAFFFAGFLPAKRAARRTRLAELSQIPGSLILFETPHRLADALADMADILGDRDAVIARELTKLHEQVARGGLRSLAEATLGEPLKGEIVVVVGPGQAGPVDDDKINARLAEALDGMSLKDAAKLVADELGVPKARVYGLALKMRGRTP